MRRRFKRRRVFRRRGRTFGRKFRRFVRKFGKRRATRRWTRSRIKGPVAPQSITVKLIYQDTMLLALANTNIFAFQELRANSLYDIDLTGTGHQPTGFDQYSLLFNNYQVKASKISVWYGNLSTDYVECMLNWGSDLFLVTDPTQYYPKEQPATIVKTLPPSIAGGTKRDQTISKYINIHGALGKHVLITDLIGTPGASPATGCYWNIAARTITSGVSTNLRIFFKVTQYVTFSDRIQLNRS